MSTNHSTRIAFLGVLIYLALSAAGYGAVNNTDCLMCHSAGSLHKTVGGKTVSLYVDPQTFKTSAHGKVACVDCHADLKNQPLKHKINKPVSAANIPEMCAKCHDNPQIMAKYHLPTDRLSTYRESYHGVANKHGDLKVATCASCHGAHGVLPSSDPKSSTSKANLPATCGKCHTDTNKNWAKGKVHVVVSKHGDKLVYNVANSFKWLTIGTMVMLIGHIGLDLFARARRRLSRLLRRAK